MDVKLSKYKSVVIPNETIQKFCLQDRIDNEIPEYAKWFGVIFINQTTGKIINQDNIFETKLLLKRHYDVDVPKPNLENTNCFGPTPDLSNVFRERRKSQVKFSELKRNSLVIHRSKIINTLGIIYDQKNEGESSMETPRKISWLKTKFEKICLKIFPVKNKTKQKTQKVSTDAGEVSGERKPSNETKIDIKKVNVELGTDRKRNRKFESTINITKLAKDIYPSNFNDRSNKSGPSSIRTIYKNKLYPLESHRDSIVLQYYDQRTFKETSIRQQYHDRNYALRRNSRWSWLTCRCCSNRKAFITT